MSVIVARKRTLPLTPTPMKLGAKTVSQPRGGRDQELPQTALGFRLVTDVFLRRLAGRFARQHVTTFVLRVAGVALTHSHFTSWR